MAARKRRIGESFKSYRENLKEESLLEEREKVGTLLWDSRNGPGTRAARIAKVARAKARVPGPGRVCRIG